MTASNSLPVVARRLALPGRLRKQLHVPERHVAIVPGRGRAVHVGAGRSHPGQLARARAGGHPRQRRSAAARPAVGRAARGRRRAGDAGRSTPRSSWPSRCGCTRPGCGPSPGPEWPLPADAIAGRLHDVAGEGAAQLRGGRPEPARGARGAGPGRARPAEPGAGALRPGARPAPRWPSGASAGPARRPRHGTPRPRRELARDAAMAGGAGPTGNP